MPNTNEATLGYEPDYAVPPGESLAEALAGRQMSQAELARRTGMSAKHINLVLKGSASISPEMALKLEAVLNIPARIWNGLEANYRGHLARLEENRQLEDLTDWASKDLIKELIRRRCIRRVDGPVQQLREVLKFFGVASIEAWNTVWNDSAQLAAYRLAKQERDPVALAAWMRIGELQAAEKVTAPFDRSRFFETLEEIRRLTTLKDPKDWWPELERLCSDAGVVLVIERELPKARVNGIARWLSPVKALIQLSGRYLRDDILWFTFFHEAAHLILHGKRNGPRDVPPTFIDTDAKATSTTEHEANDFAADILIPRRFANRLESIVTLEDVRKFAHELGIAPGIVVGRLHYDGLKTPPWGIKKLVVHYPPESIARLRAG